MDARWFEDALYPLQDKVLAAKAAVDTGFHLTGGTALGRVYLHHRYSDDLDFFVNDDDRFAVWVDRLLDAWRAGGRWDVAVQRRDPRFVRVLVSEGELPLKVELVNDVRGRVGVPVPCDGFGLVDTPENILANKITALLDREEPKDLADIWGLCTRGGLKLGDALAGASSKAVGIFSADVARALLGVTADDWKMVRWTSPPPLDQYLAELRALGEQLLLVR